MERIEKMAGKFEGKKTVAKGIIANPYTKTFDQFEEVLPYVRSIARAIPMVREVMALDDDVMISITELVQEKAEKIEYDAQDLRERAQYVVDCKEAAEEAIKDSTDNESVPYIMYVYKCQIWSVDGAGDYYTNHFEAESTVKHGIIDRRAYLRMEYERLTGESVLGVHADERKTRTEYAIIDREELRKVKRIEKKA